MANRLAMADVQSVVTLYQRGWSRRRIARELGISRDAVGGYVRAYLAIPTVEPGTAEPAAAATGPPAAQLAASIAGHHADANPAIPHTGSEPSADANPAIAHTGSLAIAPGRPSECVAYQEVIQAKLDQGLSVQRIYQDLKTEHGFTPSYYSVLRYVRRLHPQGELPYRRLEKAPGVEGQVDFGQGAFVVGVDGKRSRPHVFRIVLSHSRKAYSEVVARQTTDAFLQCLENAFHTFGGVPQTLVIDNLKAAVTKADWFEPELNPKIELFAHHYGTVILPTKPRMPRHKGKVERGIDYVQENALKGHVFASLVEQNRHLQEWEATVADTRIHGTTRQQVGKVFREVERAVLTPLPGERFANFREAQRTVHRDGHVEVERSYYSAPPEYVGRSVWVRWDSRLVRLFNHRFELVATHVHHLPGRFSTLDQHVPTQKRNPVDQSAQELLAKAQRLGPHTGQWAKALLQDRGVAGIRPLLGLLSLAKKHDVAQIEQACQSAHGHGVYRLRTVRHLLERQPSAAESAPFLEQHPLIRPLTTYGQWARASSHPLPLEEENH